MANQLSIDNSCLVILSPHLDDAIFSLAGFMKSLENKRIFIINIFSRSSFLQGRQTTLLQGTITRKHEDQMALAQFKNVRKQDLDFIDAVDRGIPFEEVFNFSLEAIKSDPLLIKARQTINANLPEEAYVFAPAGFGNHYDHVLVREAASHRADAYYADLPYACRQNEKMPDALKFLNKRRQLTHKVDQAIIDEHLRICQIYKTQVLPRQLNEMRDYLAASGYNQWL